jgi:hypothetical protein
MSSTKVKRLAKLKILVLAIYGALKIASWVDVPAAAFVRIDWPILAAPFELPITQAGGNIVNSDTPQFAFGRVEIVSEGRYRHIAEVDFANMIYRARGIAPDLSIPLRNGTYDARDGVGFEQAELLDVRICEIPPLALPRAVVRLRYASGAGSSTCDEIVQVFDLRHGRLAARHEVVYACAAGGTYAVDCNTGAITVTATAWLSSDPHCCPSARDTAVFSFLGEEPRLVSWTRVAVRKQTSPLQ